MSGKTEGQVPRPDNFDKKHKGDPEWAPFCFFILVLGLG
jgi:hypothetical protein